MVYFPTVYDTVASGGKTIALLSYKVEPENGKQEKGEVAEHLKKEKPLLSPPFSEELTLRDNQEYQKIA